MSVRARRWLGLYGTGRVAALSLCLAAILALAQVFLPLASIGAAATGVQVSIIVPDAVAPGANFTAVISISQVTNLDAANYDISFDPSQLKLNGAPSNGNLSGTVVPVANWNQARPGLVTVINDLPGVGGFSGEGSLASLQFQVIGQLTSPASLLISNGALSNDLAKAISANWTGALVRSSVQSAAASANFSVSNLSVAPATVYPTGNVTASVLVTNSGGSAGNFTLTLKVNGAIETEQIVSLGAGQLVTASFVIARSVPGSYSVDINGQMGAFAVVPTPPVNSVVSAPPPVSSPPPLPAVESPPAPPAVPAQPPVPQAGAATVEGGTEPSDSGLQNQSTAGVVPAPETPSTPSPVDATPGSAASQPSPSPVRPPASPQAKANWFIIGGGIGGVVAVAGALVIFLAVKRR